MDLYLKTPTQTEMNTALLNAGVVDAAGFPRRGFNVDVIGTIRRVTGYDGSNNPIVETDPNWHVNLRAENLSAAAQAILDPISIPAPTTPVRVWAD